jgi:beta-galactosidase GanA
MGHGGVVTATGKWTAAKGQIERLARECAAQGAWLESHPPVEARLAIVASHESDWAFAADPTTEEGFNYRGVWYHDFYRPLAQNHYWRDVIDQTADFCPYHVILMPLVPMVFRPTKDRLKQWVQEGGHLLLGPWTGHRTEELTAWTDQEFGGLEELMGAACSHEIAADAQFRFSDDAHRTGRSHGKGYALTPTTGQVLASYDDGSVAAVINQVGEGTVVTLGARLDEAAYLHLIRLLCEKANIHPLATGGRHVAVLPAMNPDTSIAAYGLVNLSDSEQTIALAEAGRDRLTGTEHAREVTLAPRDVKLIELPTASPSPAAAT